MAANSTYHSSQPTSHYRLSFIVYRLFPLLFVFVAGCTKSPEIPVIASSAEYTDLLKKAQNLSQDILEKYERGEEVTESEKGQLREALKIFDGLIAFNPNGFGPYFGAGKINVVLGEPERALVHMQKFVELGPPSPTEEVKQLVAEAYYTSGKIYESNAEFDRAEQCAVEAVKNSEKHPNYLAFLASAKLRKNDEKEAKRLIDKALKIDPLNSRAKQLQRLFKKS